MNQVTKILSLLLLSYFVKESCLSVKYRINMLSKGYPLEAKNASKNWNQSVHIFWARLASFGHLGLISDPLIVSKFHNETQDPKGQENKIYTIVKGRETFYRRHTVAVTSCSEVKYALKSYPLEAKNASKNWNQSVHIFWARLASFGYLGLISDPLIVPKFQRPCLLHILKTGMKN